jgi:hypothetical protein
MKENLWSNNELSLQANNAKGAIKSSTKKQPSSSENKQNTEVKM